MKIVKHSGNIVDFSPLKLKKSLLNSGASPMDADFILEAIEKEIHEGVSTKQIYKQAFALLKKARSSHAARYNLKEAIRLLGPAGFFFEKYIARLFEAENYEVKTNLILRGNCISHEIDVLAKKDGVIAMIECKFHMGKDAVSDVKVPMYILSRFNDLKEKNHVVFSSSDMISKCWIVTNNRFTSDAIEFARCSQLNLMSWDFPEKDNIRTKINMHHLYPVTCLTSLSLAEKERLLLMDVILAKEILTNPECLERIGISSNRAKNILRETSELCRFV